MRVNRLATSINLSKGLSMRRGEPGVADPVARRAERFHAKACHLSHDKPFQETKPLKNL
jgi:hypothetical protein